MTPFNWWHTDGEEAPVTIKLGKRRAPETDWVEALIFNSLRTEWTEQFSHDPMGPTEEGRRPNKQDIGKAKRVTDNVCKHMEGRDG